MPMGPACGRSLTNSPRCARTFGVPVIGFGPLAASAEAELVAHGAIDRAIGLGRVHDRPGDGTSGQTVEASIGRYLRGHTQLTTLTRDDPWREAGWWSSREP